ncbi:MAG: MG2 domain-containing protein, partial [Bacteroidota bacterium]
MYGYYPDREWEDRDEVCKPAYYHEGRFLVRNVISSNLGIIAKQNDDKETVVIVTDLLSGQPVSGAQVNLYNFQQQNLYAGISDGNGMTRATTDYRPDFITAEVGEDVAYLKLDYASGLSLSRFDVNGVAARGGVKGQLYAERGVWRPGDSVFLNFVLEDRLLKLPPDYPISFEVYDVQGRLRESRTELPATGKMYALHFTTDRDDPTGNWRAVVKAGGQVYRKNLKIETVKPNRLKIDLDFGDEPLSASNNTITLSSAWLHGAIAKNLKADVELQLRQNYGGFEDWKDYIFHDPARRFRDNSTKKIFSGSLNEQGEVVFKMPELGNRLPGRLTASFKTRVFEPGGNFSVDNIRTQYLPFTHFAGLKLPKNRWGGNELAQNKEGALEFASVDPSGQAAAGRKLEVGIYKVRWRYWWQDSYDNVSRFNSSQHQQ